jgi:hypothetical protein
MRYNCCRRNVIVNAPSKSCNFQSRCGFVQLRTLTHCSCSTVNSSLLLYYFFACVLGTTIHFGSSQLHAALADMVGPIPKVRAVHYSQMCPGLLPHVASRRTRMLSSCLPQYAWFLLQPPPFIFSPSLRGSFRTSLRKPRVDELLFGSPAIIKPFVPNFNIHIAW